MPTTSAEAVAVPARRGPGRPRKVQPAPEPAVVPSPEEDLTLLTGADMRKLLGWSTWTLRRAVLYDPHFPASFSVAGGHQRWFKSDALRYLRWLAEMAAEEKRKRMAARADRKAGRRPAVTSSETPDASDTEPCEPAERTKANLPDQAGKP
ncbi:hypothetical protein [Paraburkholderia youngii]|uniref:Uncharacterized protein n=1 Tax=Paraburkholderia youngii TaxID=2782701 RepID=A0A7Y6K127_9BURK|nr:hypothetical protein [Paraburkholderia youngii]NUY01553.1 hypothetical protein [Paraburkholderia youngii]